MQSNKTAGIAIATVVLASAICQSLAAPITGDNAALTGMGNKIYVPMSNGSSGTITTTNNVGRSPDTVVLGYTTSTIKGAISYAYGFNLAAALTSGQTIDPDASKVCLTFGDLNFQTETRNVYFGYTETLGLSFLKDASSSVPDTPQLLLDWTNYGNYREDDFGNTANTSVTYTFTLAQLGATAADLNNNVSNDKEFGLAVTIKSNVTHSRTGSDALTQTQESVGPATFTLVTPEPAALTMLAVGAMTIIRRRKA